MAIYHLHVDCVGRSKGKTSVGASAYRSCEKLHNQTDGVTHDFRRKKGLLFKAIVCPENAPDFCKTREQLWNEVEKKENRKNSVFAKDIDIGLQAELTLEQNLECLQKLIENNFTKKGLVADLCVHDGHKGNKNSHAHILSTTRAVTPDGWGNKAWSKLKDEHEWIDQLREDWETIVNAKFRELGIDKKIDHRTLEAQGIDRRPQQHIGPTATAMERKGKTPDRQRYVTEVTQEVTAVTSEELEEALSKNQEFTELSKQENVLKHNEQAEQTFIKRVEAEVAQLQSPKEKLDFANKRHYELILNTWFRYVKVNRNSEINYYANKSINATFESERNTARRQIHLATTIANNDKYTNSENLKAQLHEYRTTTFQKFPDRLKAVTDWVRTTEDVITRSCQRVAQGVKAIIDTKIRPLLPTPKQDRNRAAEQKKSRGSGWGY